MVSRQLLGNGQQTVAWEWSADSCLGMVSRQFLENAQHTQEYGNGQHRVA